MLDKTKLLLGQGIGKLVFKFIDVSMIIKIVAGWLLDAYRNKGQEQFARYVLSLGKRALPETATDAELNELCAAFEAMLFVPANGKLIFSSPAARLGRAFANCVK